MAIIVISIVIAVIAPPILLAAATRLQNQRVEQATQLAQGEIDRIRLLVEQGQYESTDLPPITTVSTVNQFRDTTTPASISNLNTNNLNNPTAQRTSPTQSFSVDLERDGTPDFVVQTFLGLEQKVQVIRPSGTVDIPVAFWMGVRVYSAQAFNNSARPTLTKPTSLGFTSGVNLQSPLVVLYTPIVRSDQRFAMCKYRKFIKESLSLNDPLAATCQE